MVVCAALNTVGFVYSTRRKPLDGARISSAIPLLTVVSVEIDSLDPVEDVIDGVLLLLDADPHRFFILARILDRCDVVVPNTEVADSKLPPPPSSVANGAEATEVKVPPYE